MHISISGNIGVGKSSLTYMLSKHYKWKALYEDIDNNPYLMNFYDDMVRWSFNIQIYFLKSKLQQIQNIKNQGVSFFQDRSIYEDAFIFAQNLNELKILEERDFKTYIDLFNIVTQNIEPPDLIIYLKSNISQIKQHILSRGRQYEKHISDDYLNKLNNKYNKWINQYDKSKILIIDISNMDFVNNQKDFMKVVDSLKPYIG